MVTDQLAHSAAERDRAAVEAVIREIPRGADLHQWDEVRAAFMDRVDLDYGTSENLPADEVIDRWRRLLPGFDATE
jgi:hypothetical protein